MNQTRSNKFEKRRKNTNTITILAILGGALVVLFLVLWIFTGGEDNIAKEEADSSENSADAGNGDAEDNGDFLITDPNADEDSNDSENAEADHDKDEDKDNEEDKEAEEDAEKEEEEEKNPYEERESAEATDSNVSEAYTGDWDPVGTEQEGPHNTDFNDGSQDRIEIKRATSLVTGLSEDNMVEHWVGNNGPDKVIATVSDSSGQEVYRVFLDWVDGEGWQPTQVEELIENDGGR